MRGGDTTAAKLSACAIAVFAALLAPRPAVATLVVDKFVVEGAKKTTLGTLRARMRLRENDLVDFAILEQAQLRLRETGLFSKAEVTIDMPREQAVQLMYLDSGRHPVTVRVKVEEKLSWYIIPTASLGGGDYSFGVVYAEQNLSGHGIQVLAAGQYGETQSFGLAGLRLPYVGYLPFALSTYGTFRVEDLPYYEDHRRIMEVPAQLAGGEVEAGWVLTPHLRLLVAGRYRRQWVRQAQILVAEEPLPPFNTQEGNLVDVRLGIEYDRTMVPEGLLRGTRLHIKNQFAHPLWGSDFGYVRADFELGLFGYVLKTYPSIFIRAVLISPTSAGGIPVTEVLRAGGSELRGFQANEFHGDTLVIMQLEEQVMIFRRFKLPVVGVELSLAGAAFVDTGAVIERHPGGLPATVDTDRRLQLSDFHVGVGGGLRLVLPGVAIPAIRIDVGYGIDVRDYAVSFAIAGGAI